MEAFLAKVKEGRPLGQGRPQADAGNIGEEEQPSSRKRRVCQKKTCEHRWVLPERVRAEFTLTEKDGKTI
jgi:hypothetical protein